MDNRFYPAPDLNIEHIAYDAEGMFFGQGYQVQHFGNKDQMVVQLRMGGDFEAVIGMQAAATLTLQRFPSGMLATLGQQQWIDKAAAGALGMLLLWPLALTAGIGVFRQADLENQVFHTLDTAVLRQRANVHAGPIPADVHAQMQQQQTPPPAYTQTQQQAGAPPTYSGQAPRNGPLPVADKIQCFNCQEINEAEDLYCSHCGKPVILPKKRCPACKAEVKANAAFCTKCGTSF